MAFNNIVAWRLAMVPSARQIVYFGPFTRGDFIRSLTVRLADAAQTGRGEFEMSVGEFDATTLPASTLGSFLLGRLRFDRALTLMYPSTQENEVVVALNLLVESGTKWIGVNILNLDSTDSIQGAALIDALPANVREAMEISRRPRGGGGGTSSPASSS